MCGQIAAYNDSAPQPGPDWMSLLTRRLTVRGFLLRDHGDRRAAFEAAVSRAVRDGALSAREQVWDGLELAPAAFEALLSGSSVGKVLVKLRD